MGVPKFFRYTSERYPCLNELVKQYQIPDFDNMYLDMNGIIHNCSHPDDNNPHFRITEEKIFKDIFHYIGILFQIIKPKKLFFMAIDGVAPRAKMNQQRGRRFRSAREAEQLEKQALAKGEELPKEKRFDSNCITPGTVFMVRLHEQLKYFVKTKMSTDPLWAKVRVILSGHETPGEGEHKIMDYIRWTRSQSNYDPNTRHCLYGLDADLIMLGMCTHEPHFALLREEVKFGKSTQSRSTCPEETNFYLLHLSLLREYLEQEFISIKDKLPFKYDIEKIVDDWVLMGFLVGNDFIPNLPNMHISNDALPLLYKNYMEVLPNLDGYINEAGDLHLGRFETFMQQLAVIDREKFQDTYADIKYFEGKTGRRLNARERREYKPNNDETFNVNIEDIKANKPDDELQALINATDDMLLDDIDLDDDNDYQTEISDDEANFNMEFKIHKNDYYMNKLDYSKVTDEVLASQAEGYVRAIQWNLFYYYKGCPSWCWYYPHHYAPYISDVKGFKDLKIEFELGEPFKPFEQLLAVLPSASKQLLPTPFHELMTDEDSPIVHYYPINFETDLNGKKNDWEAVVLIPFIDEMNLLTAMAPCYQRLTDEERRRNAHGPMLVYDWSSENLGVALAPEYFPPISECHAKEKPIWRDQLNVPENKLIRGMLPNATRDLVYPGFPTMRHLKYTSKLKKCRVKVFDQPSLNNNMILHLVREDDENVSIERVACEYLGKIVWAGWPHLTRAKVMSVSNESKRLHLLDRHKDSEAPEYSTELNTGNLHKQWISERSTIIEHNMNRLGIELGDVSVILHAVNLRGYKYIVENNVQMSLEPEWCTIPCGYALQAVVTDVKAHVIQTVTKYSTPQEAFPAGDTVFLITQGPYYGCLAKIVECEVSARGGRIKLQVCESPEPVPVVTYATPYKTANHAAAAARVTPQVMSRITGCVFVVLGQRNNNSTEGMKKINVGLNLKFNKKNLEVSGYTRRGFTNTWLYSDRCVQLVSSYLQAYPELFETLGRTFGNDIFFESDLWPNNVGEDKPQAVQQWLNDQAHSKAGHRECGSEALEPEEMKQLADCIDQQLIVLREQQKMVTLQVKMNLLYKPDLHDGNIAPDPKADFRMYDRVVCVAKHITVPLGAKGTITAIYKASSSNTVRLSDKLNSEPTYQVLFDETFPGAMTEELFDTPRFYKMQSTYMINISYGRKLRDMHTNTLTNTTLTSGHNVLRKEDGHHSAFASYSPTKDRQTPSNEHRSIKVIGKESSPQLDSSTEILKNLLKISMPDSSPGTSNLKNVPEPQTNWRVKNDNSQPITLRKSQPPANWRTKEPSTVSYNKVPPPYDERNKQQYKPPLLPTPPQPPMHQPILPIRRQPPMPPLPTFAQPFNQGPRPSQVPFPQFQPYHQARNMNYNQVFNSQESFYPRNQEHNQTGDIRFQCNNRGYGQSGSGFPISLPNVTGNFAMMPPSNWLLSEQHKQMSPSQIPNEMVRNKPPPPPSMEITHNPFVPLQVQASQRRVQNPGGQNKKDESSVNNSSTKPAPVVLSQVPIRNQISTNEPKPARNKQNKKKKSRLAANLPFQTD